CRQCGRQGDAIAFLREHDGLGFREAAAVAGHAVDAPSRPPTPRTSPPGNDAPPPAAWQARARAVIAQAIECLWSDVGPAALAYLQEQRGLTDGTIRVAGLGYNPAAQYDEPATWGLGGQQVCVPRGLVIPCEAAGQLWYVKVRRPGGEPK